MGKPFRDTLNERLQDPEFKSEWDASEPERQIIRKIVAGLADHDLTQEKHAQDTNIPE